jgi:hypothetical protein
MKDVETPVKKEQSNGSSSSDVQKGIEQHKKAAMHHEEAAKHHSLAVKNHESGKRDAAFESTIKAQGHSALASEAEKEVVKQHALKS